MFSIKMLFVFMASLLIMGSTSNTLLGVSNVGKASAAQCQMHMSAKDCPMLKQGGSCPMHRNMTQFKGNVSAIAKQDPPPHNPSEGQGCSRPSKNDPSKGVKDGTVGCNCVRKTPCNGDRPKEDPGSKDDNYKTRCKNYCYPDRCSCPNPCKS